jgi:hypothetical protein
MKRNIAVWMAISGAALLAAFALSLSHKETTPPQAVVEPAQHSEQEGEVNPGLAQTRSTPPPPESSSSKATTVAPPDWSELLKSSLRDAQLGIPEAQYRAAVLLRDCRNAHVTSSDFDRLRDAGLTEGHISLIQRRVARCASVKELVHGDPRAASKSWFEAALRQRYPIATARDLITGQERPTAEAIDGALRAALEAAGDDRTLRSESFFYVLAAMDKRSMATSIEADATVRNAWTLLHCREAWDCDLDATMAHLSNELTPVNLRLTVERAEEIARELQARNWSNVPLN